MGNRILRRREDPASDGLVFINGVGQVAESIALFQVLVRWAENPKELNVHLVTTVGRSGPRVMLRPAYPEGPKVAVPET